MILDRILSGIVILLLACAVVPTGISILMMAEDLHDRGLTQLLSALDEVIPQTEKFITQLWMIGSELVTLMASHWDSILIVAMAITVMIIGRLLHARYINKQETLNKLREENYDEYVKTLGGVPLATRMTEGLLRCAHSYSTRPKRERQ